MQFDLNTGAVSEHRTRIRTEPFADAMTCNGDLYITDQGQSDTQLPDGRVFRLTPVGDLECLIDCSVSPSGLVLNKSENLLFVGTTCACQVWCISLVL